MQKRKRIFAFFPLLEYIRVWCDKSPFLVPFCNCFVLLNYFSCFANVVLQCLTYTRPLAAYLLEGHHKKEECMLPTKTTLKINMLYDLMHLFNSNFLCFIMWSSHPFYKRYSVKWNFILRSEKCLVFHVWAQESHWHSKGRSNSISTQTYSFGNTKHWKPHGVWASRRCSWIYEVSDRGT